MAAEASPLARSRAGDTRRDGAERPAAERPADDPQAAGDALEPPELRAGLLAWIGAGAIVFIVVSMALLYGVYKLQLSNPGRDPAHAFPEPRLETSINPRSVPAEPEPGPKPLVLRHSAVEPRADMARAIQAEAARGAQAFDPPPADGATGNVAQ